MVLKCGECPQILEITKIRVIIPGRVRKKICDTNPVGGGGGQKRK